MSVSSAQVWPRYTNTCHVQILLKVSEASLGDSAATETRLLFWPLRISENKVSAKKTQKTLLVRPRRRSTIFTFKIAILPLALNRTKFSCSQGGCQLLNRVTRSGGDF